VRPEGEEYHGVVGCANHALSLAVLRGGIQARHAQLDTVREKEGTGGGVIELLTIVTLDSLDGEAELWTPKRKSGQARRKHQILHVKEKSRNNANNHQPPQDSTCIMTGDVHKSQCTRSKIQAA
jgi:hypothetical protein